MMRRSVGLEEISEDGPSQQLNDEAVMVEPCNGPGWRNKPRRGNPSICPLSCQVWTIVWTIILIFLSLDVWNRRIISDFKLRYEDQIPDARGRRSHNLLKESNKDFVNATGTTRSSKPEKELGKENHKKTDKKHVGDNENNMHLSIVAPYACAIPRVCSNDDDDSLRYSVQPADNRPMIFRVDCQDDTKRFKAVEISVKGSIAGNFSVGFVNWVNKPCGKSTWPHTHLSSLVSGDRYAVSVHSGRTVYHIPISHFLNRPVTAHTHSIQILGFKTRPQTINIIYVKLTLDPPPPGWIIPAALPAAPTTIFCRRPGVIALGIDDGNDALMHLALDRLREAAVPATFFLVGRHLRKSRAREAFARRALAEGHTVQHHTWNHGDAEEMPAAELCDDLDKTLAAAREAFGVHMRYFRPPRGRYDATLLHELSRRNMSNVMWSYSLSDYGPATNESVWGRFTAAMDGHHPARVGLIGVQHFSMRGSVDMIPRMAAAARDKGWRFVGMDECLTGGDSEALKQ